MIRTTMRYEEEASLISNVAVLSVLNYCVLIIKSIMGKKGAKGKGKPVVMTQAEFFQSTAPAIPKGADGDWGKASSFLGGEAPKVKVVVADKKEEVDLMKAAIEA